VHLPRAFFQHLQHSPSCKILQKTAAQAEVI